uniref:Uncharacterized protein n=1 Tax=Arundo donax TaxID=35708 RepID=A0A0A9FY47_ARUDO
MVLTSGPCNVPQDKSIDFALPSSRPNSPTNCFLCCQFETHEFFPLFDCLDDVMERSC